VRFKMCVLPIVYSMLLMLASSECIAVDTNEIILVVRGDDIGSSQASNEGIIKCYREGILRTCELMVPCPWFNQAAKMLRENPGLDVGIHLTLTSEWNDYKWGPITQSPTLVDSKGNFRAKTKNWDDPNAQDGFWNAKPDMKEVEAELRAQIELAMKELPGQVSHATGHMGISDVDPQMEKLTRKLEEEYNLGIDLRSYGVKSPGGFGKGTDTPEQREKMLVELLERIGPGIWHIGGHPAMDTPESHGFGHPGYTFVANERSGEVFAFTSPKVMEVIKRRNIKLMSFGDLKRQKAKTDAAATKPGRFFSDSSFWNTPIGDNPEVDPNSDRWIGLLKTEPSGNRIGINATDFAIPVYEADKYTPTYDVKRRGPIAAERSGLDPNSSRYKRTMRYNHGPNFKNVPIPDGAIPDPETDHHMAIVDWERLLVWDMWGAEKLPDGSWASNTGMVYRLDGPGVFKIEDFPIKNGESIHFYGPGRAAGVPIIAGLIMYDEVKAGEIRHKIAMATRFNALQEFVFPATWTDGHTKGGIPEGAVIQLDPRLNLDQFNLWPGEKAIAKAIQQYGAVIVDAAGGSPLYAEGLYGHPDKSWKGVLREWEGGINSIPLDHYRVLKVHNVVPMGDGRR